LWGGIGSFANFGWWVGLVRFANVPIALAKKFFPVWWAFFNFFRVGLCRLVGCLAVGWGRPTIAANVEALAMWRYSVFRLPSAAAD